MMIFRSCNLIRRIEDVLLALDQVHEKVTGGYLCGFDRNDSGSYLFELYETEKLAARASAG